MIKKLCNLYIKHKTKNLTRIPLFTMTFNWRKFQKEGKKGSCIMCTIHPDIAKDPILKEKLSECVDQIRNNNNKKKFTKI